MEALLIGWILSRDRLDVNPPSLFALVRISRLCCMIL
jgi:hypothetical protein